MKKRKEERRRIRKKEAWLICIFTAGISGSEIFELKILALEMVSDIDMVFIPVACCKFVLIVTGSPLTNVSLTIVSKPS